MVQDFVTRIAVAMNCRKGISALEYAILAGVLVGVISTAVTAFGTDITNLFNSAGSKLTLP